MERERPEAGWDDKCQSGSDPYIDRGGSFCLLQKQLSQTLHCRWAGLADSSLARLQFTDVLDDLVDLRVAEHRAERRHGAHLAVLDAVANKVVVSFCVHELRALTESTATIRVTPPTCRTEQLADIDWRNVRRSVGRLPLSRRSACQ